MKRREKLATSCHNQQKARKEKKRKEIEKNKKTD
jgi:hypothetical protein